MYNDAGLPKTILVAPLFFPTTAHYLAVARANLAVTDIALRYDKRHKATHRTTIASTHGSLTLTVPVSIPALDSNQTVRWCDITISQHGQWWRTMPQSIRTAYGASPHFQHIFDCIMPFFSKEWVGRPITELATASDAEVRRLLCIDTPFSTTLPNNPSGDMPAQTVDLRNRTAPYPAAPPYQRLYPQTDIGNLECTGIIDYLMNIGPGYPQIFLQSQQ